MKQITFTYIDAKQKATDRKVLMIDGPTDKYTGYDVGDLTDTAIQEFAKKYDAAFDRFLWEARKLEAEYDLQHSFRQFVTDRMQGTEIKHAY